MGPMGILTDEFNRIVRHAISLWTDRGRHSNIGSDSADSSNESQVLRSRPNVSATEGQTAAAQSQTTEPGGDINMKLTVILSIVSSILGLVIKEVTPEVKTYLEGVVSTLDNKAKTSGSEWDKLLATLIADVFNLPQS